MTDIAALVQVATAIALFVAPVVLAIRFVAGSGTVVLDDLLPAGRDPGWPRGVQEEEPRSWGAGLAS